MFYISIQTLYDEESMEKQMIYWISLAVRRRLCKKSVDGSLSFENLLSRKRCYKIQEFLMSEKIKSKKMLNKFKKEKKDIHGMNSR